MVSVIIHRSKGFGVEDISEKNNEEPQAKKVVSVYLRGEGLKARQVCKKDDQDLVTIIV